MSGTCPNTKAKVASISNNDAMVQVADEPQPPLKCKHANKNWTEAFKQLKAQKVAASEEQQCTVNIQLANLEVGCSVNTNLPTPCPVDQSNSAAGLRCSNSWAEIASLIAQQKQSTNTADVTAATSNLLVEEKAELDESSDNNEDETPSKRQRKVIIPDPQTPVEPVKHKLTTTAKKREEKEGWGGEGEGREEGCQ